MEKMNCDIIQDLIPSYADEICSDATKICVEEHLRNCDTCKRIYDLCRKTAFSANSIESRQLNGLKKWNHKIRLHNLFSYLLLLFMAGFGVYTFIGSPSLSFRGYYVPFTICLLGICLFTAPMSMLQPMKKMERIITGLSILFNGLGLLTMYVCLTGIHSKHSPFDLAPEKIGPLVSNILIVCFIMQLLLTILLLLNPFLHNQNTRLGLCATLSGCFLALAYRRSLNNMNTLKDFQNNVLEITLVIWGISILGSLLIRLLDNRKD